MSSLPANPSVADRLGGRWAISSQGALITVPLGFAVLVASSPTPGDVPIWCAISVVAVLMGGVCLLLMDRTVFRDRAVRPVALAWVIGSAVLVAGVYVGTAVALGVVWHVVDGDLIAVQFLPLLVISVAWGLLLTLVLDSQWRFRVQREELVREEVQIQLASAQGLQLLSDMNASVRRDVSDQVRSSNRSLVDRIDALANSGDADASELAGIIRAAADSTVRPLSHELEKRARRRHRMPGPWTALANTVRYQPFRPLAVSVIYAVTATPREINDFGMTVGAGLFVVTVGLVFAIMLGLNAALERWPHHHMAIYLAGLVAIQVPTVMLSPLRARLTGEVITGSELVITVGFGTIIVLATSSFGSWNRTRQDVLAQFRMDVQHGTVAMLARNEALARATWDVALVLHGSVQSQLHACALSIEEATRFGDLVEVNRALVRARALLERPDLVGVTTIPASLAEAIDHQIAQWRGLLTVSVAIDPTVDSVGVSNAVLIADVVEEGVANAFHHGRASSVEVRISLDDEAVVIRIEDDGIGLGTGEPGLGSRLFSHAASQWRLEGVGAGSVLEVRVDRARLGAPRN